MTTYYTTVRNLDKKVYYQFEAHGPQIIFIGRQLGQHRYTPKTIMFKVRLLQHKVQIFLLISQILNPNKGPHQTILVNQLSLTF